MILAIILLSILCACLIATSAYVFIRSYKLVLYIESLEEAISFYKVNMLNILKKGVDTRIKLREIDARGAFKSDDEVGTVFYQIDDIVNDFVAALENGYEYVKDEEK